MSKNVYIKVHEAAVLCVVCSGCERQMESHEGDICVYGRESGRMAETEEQ
jgi:hypothetical protein